MRLLLILAAAALAWGCTKKPEAEKSKIRKAVEEVQEAPVKYAKGLRTSVEKAQAVADKANKKIKTDQTEYDKITEGM